MDNRPLLVVAPNTTSSVMSQTTVIEMVTITFFAFLILSAFKLHGFPFTGSWFKKGSVLLFKTNQVPAYANQCILWLKPVTTQRIGAEDKFLTP